jgi:flagellin-like protein
LITRARKSRKAISPILATLLLVVIAVAAIVVTYAWIMTYMNNAGHQAGVKMYVLNVEFSNSGGKIINIDIGNSGTQSCQITGLYIGTSQATEQNQSITAMPLLNGGTARITITYNWNISATYWFKVYSDVGQILEWPQQAPSS